MTPKRLKQVEEIYHAVLDFPPYERQKFIEDSCGNDAELLNEVESRLSSDKIHTELFDSTSDKSSSNKIKTNIAGSQIKQYKIKSLLGEGGMGEVFLAYDTTLERNVAIKFLSKTFTQDGSRLKRFFQEAKAASALNHPNIITVYEIGEYNKQPYIVSEFIDGDTLSRFLSFKELTLDKVIDIFIQIASALKTAHEAGIVHRDIKPDNVMIRRDGIVKVLDFGLAKLGQESTKIDSEASTKVKKLTVDGMILGTPQYMSPEQARGQKVDERADIFSCGVLLYEMISGKTPFDGVSTLDIIGSILKDEPQQLSEIMPEIPADLERIVNKSMRKDRERRYQNISDLLVDLTDVKKTVELQPISNNNTVIVKPQNTRANTTSIATARRFSLIHAIGFLFIAGILAALFWWFFGERNVAITANLKTEEVVNWTSTPGEVYTVGSFSPDGRMVAFTSTKVGSKNIWVKQTSSGEAIQVTKDEFKNQDPIWSPNGEELAFFSAKGGEPGIWRIPTLGGSPKLIAKLEDGGSQLRSWSKNNRIYYESKNELNAVATSTGQIEKLTDLSSRGIKASWLNVSDDEEKFAFATSEGETFSLWIEDFKSKTPKKLFDSKTEIRNIVWHPDGKRLFYSSPVDGNFQIFVTDTEGTKPKQISAAEQDCLALDAASDGTKILFGSAKEESDVWGVNLKDAKEFIAASDIDSELWADISPDGKTLAYQSVKHLSQGNKLFSGNILTKTLGSNSQPVELVKNGGLPKWSPDGKSLVFMQSNGAKRQLKTVSALGNEQKTLTSENVLSVSYSLLPYLRIQTNDFSWSPDSSKIAFIAEKDGNRNIWVKNADLSDEQNLSQNIDSNLFLFCPIWSADGKRIVYSTKTQSANSDGKPTYEIKIVDLETKTSKQILSRNSFIRLLGWSQSGNEIIFASVLNSSSSSTPTDVSIESIDLNGGNFKQLISLKETYLFNIQLSPDKKTIAFASNREQKDNIWLIPASGGEAKQMTNNNDSRLYFSSLAWSPDSNSIFFGKQLRYSLLSMLTNFQ